MVSQRGLTLVELLLASALFSTILLALGGLYAGSGRALGANDLAGERHATAVAAAELLRYDIGLAGYRGTDSAAAGREFSGATLTVALGASDEVAVQYYEDRFVASDDAELRRIVFAVGRDDQGRSTLLRREGAAAAQSAVRGATRLDLVEVHTRSGQILDPERLTRFPDDLSALHFELGFDDGRSETIFVPLVNGQRPELIGHGASRPLDD